MSPAERDALARMLNAQRRRLFAVGSILSLLREALDDEYAGDKHDAPDMSWACNALLEIVDRIAAELDPSACLNSAELRGATDTPGSHGSEQ